MTTNKNEEEKRMLFFDMQEHPERYTDEQMEALLAGEDMKEFLQDMAMARMAQQKTNPKSVDVNKAWREFADKRKKLSEKPSPSYGYRFKIAASIAGIIFLSGITFAAIFSGVFSSSTSGDAPQMRTEQSSSVPGLALRDSDKVEADSLHSQIVVFDNAELGEVISQMAAFYHVKAEFGNVKAQHIRIFFNWDKEKTLRQNIDILNAFDRIRIAYSPSDKTLKVE